MAQFFFPSFPMSLTEYFCRTMTQFSFHCCSPWGDGEIFQFDCACMCSPHWRLVDGSGSGSCYDCIWVSFCAPIAMSFEYVHTFGCRNRDIVCNRNSFLWLVVTLGGLGCLGFRSRPRFHFNISPNWIITNSDEWWLLLFELNNIFIENNERKWWLSIWICDFEYPTSDFRTTIYLMSQYILKIDFITVASAANYSYGVTIV